MICQVDFNTVAFNHASILAHLLLLTLTTKYKLSLQIRFYQPERQIYQDMGYAIYQFINIVIYQLLLLLLLLLIYISIYMYVYIYIYYF